jgi:flagellar M-ring protein FliF
VISVAAIVAFGGGTYLWAADYARTSRYEPLFSKLDSKDAAEIAQKLAQRKIPYKVSEEGGAILVPSTLVHTTRLTLAGEGLPRGGAVGFELMDKLSIGATDFDRRVNYMRALTGELVRTIREIDGVEDARVHIVIPENSYFVSKARPATAAVFLKIRPLTEITRAQIRGIVHLVSRSVEGLRPEDIAVIDLYGRLLTGDTSPDSASGDRSFVSNLEAQQGFQQELERSLQTLLENVLGPGNVAAKVAAELNFDQKTIDKTIFQPVTEGVLRSMQELQETFKGQGSAPSGIPGTTSNIPQYQTSTQGGSSDYQKREATKNFEINEIKERTVVAAGSVKRLSVAVVVNRELDDAARTMIEKTVAAAIGLDPERKDTVLVSGMSFNTTLADQIKKQMEESQKAQPRVEQPLVRNVAIAGGAVLLVVVLVLALRRRPAPSSGLQRARSKVDVAQAFAAAASAQAGDEMPPGLPDPEQAKRRRLREEIERVARHSPENAAQLIRTWLTEDRR